MSVYDTEKARLLLYSEKREGVRHLRHALKIPGLKKLFISSVMCVLAHLCEVIICEIGDMQPEPPVECQCIV